MYTRTMILKPVNSYSCKPTCLSDGQETEENINKLHRAAAGDTVTSTDHALKFTVENISSRNPNALIQCAQQLNQSSEAIAITSKQQSQYYDSEVKKRYCLESSNASAINLAPAVTNNPPAAPSARSWASLFTSTRNAVTPPAISNTSASNTITTGYNKKPVASQNLPAPVKKTSPSELQQLERNRLANLDFTEFLTNYKSDWATISLRPRGLTNRSNYCYINSILQALLGCSPLCNLIRSIPRQAANLCEVKTPTVNAMITFMSKYSKLKPSSHLSNTKAVKTFYKYNLQCDSAFEATEIYKVWSQSGRGHIRGRQEDAEEFLSFILNKLNDEMLEVMQFMGIPNIDHNGTPLSDIFRGELRSSLHRECEEHSTESVQPFFTLPLNIEKAHSVEQALEIFSDLEELKGVMDSKSKQEVMAWQETKLEKLPPVLILQLKCFCYSPYGCTKIIKKFEYPLKLKIDAKSLPFKKYWRKQRAYRLFAVVYHVGNEATRGHYITDVYHTGYGLWLRYDDSSVKPVSEDHVLLPERPRVPYLLCYRRCDTILQQNNNKSQQ